VTAPRIAVLGAGFAGLVAAVELERSGAQVVVLEAGDTVGGLARTRHVGGIAFDVGAHFITNRLATAVGIMDRCDDAGPYGEAVWLDDRSVSYPFGLLRNPRFVRAAIAARIRQEPAITAADRFRTEYGTALADEVAIPLLEAWSGLPAEDLAPEVLEKIPSSVSETMVLTAARRLTGRSVAIGYCGEAPQSANVWHVYPRDGLDVVTDALAAQLREPVRLRTPVEEVLLTGERVSGVRAGGDTLDVDGVVSTVPAPLLARLVDHPALAPLADLRYRAMVFLQLHLRGRGLVPAPVMWFPERSLPFFRVSEAPVTNPGLAPPGETVLTVDFGAQVGDATWNADPAALLDAAVRGLTPLVPDLSARLVDSFTVRTSLAYPVLALATTAARRRIVDHGIGGLAVAGRNAEFAHLLMEDVCWRTRRTVRELAAALTPQGVTAGYS